MDERPANLAILYYSLPITPYSFQVKDVLLYQVTAFQAETHSVL